SPQQDYAKNLLDGDDHSPGALISFGSACFRCEAIEHLAVFPARCRVLASRDSADQSSRAVLRFNLAGELRGDFIVASSSGFFELLYRAGLGRTGYGLLRSTRCRAPEYLFPSI